MTTIQPLSTNDRTLTDLGWPQLLAALAEGAGTARGQVIARTLPFLDSRAAVETSLLRIEEVRGLLRLDQGLPLGGIGDPESALDRAEKGAALAGEEIRSCGQLIRAAAETRRFLLSRRERAPLLNEVAQGLVDLGPLAARIDAVFEPSGSIKDSASEALATYRRRARHLHAELKQRAESMVHDPDFSLYLQDSYYSVRNDRYVLPIQATYRSKVPGIVHNASQSGLTLFIEPQTLVDLGNELSIAESLALEEERQILTELSAYLGDHASELKVAIRCLATLDVTQAAGRLADRLDASPATVLEEATELRLVGARHPLLVLQHKRVRPNDLRLGETERALVVSGPNAGGKTVSITTAGLCSLMVRAGLPIPAASGSRIPLFFGILSAMGDAQDLSRDLSTFSAHLTTLKDILRQAGKGWLVLIDEIAADTDPREGAALATSILHEMAGCHATVLVTTHLDEVKALGLVDPRFVNARMCFDAATLAPTFILELGAAGASNAIEIARQVGLPRAVIERARAQLQTGGALSLAIKALESAKNAAQQLSESVTQERQALAAEREQLSIATKAAQEARLAAEVRVREALAQEFELERAKVTRLVAELQAQPTIRKAQAAQAELASHATEQHREAERARTTLSGAPERITAKSETVTVGARVRVLSLKKDGEVLAVDEEGAVVGLGTLRIRLPFTDLVLLGKGKRGPEPMPRQKSKDVGAQAIVSPEARVDVRGMRADEALKEIELFLDHSSYAGPNCVFIVHGHGTGILKKLIRESLGRMPYVARFRPGGMHEGGDGVTVVDLKG